MLRRRYAIEGGRWKDFLCRRPRRRDTSPLAVMRLACVRGDFPLAAEGYELAASYSTQ